MRDIVIYLGSMQFPDKTAGALRAFSIAKSLREIGYKAVLIGLDSKMNKLTPVLESKVIYEGFDCYSLPLPKSVREWAHHMHSIKEFKVIMNAYGFNSIRAVIAMEYEAIALWKLSKFCDKIGVKLIADAEEWYEKSKHPFPMNIFKDFDTTFRMHYVYPKKIQSMICISRFFYEYYSDNVEERVHIPGTIDSNSPKWHNLPHYSPNDIFTIGYAGFSDRKMRKERIDILVKAVCRLNEQGKPCKLRLAGVKKSVIEEYVPEITKQSAYHNRIEFIGVVSHIECLEMIATSDFSAIIREDKRVTRAGFPTKLSESLGCGTPVITTPSSNVSDYVINGKNGFVTRGFDLESLTEAIEVAMELNTEHLIEMHQRTKEQNPLTYDKFNHHLSKIL